MKIEQNNQYLNQYYKNDSKVSLETKDLFGNKTTDYNNNIRQPINPSIYVASNRNMISSVAKEKSSEMDISDDDAYLYKLEEEIEKQKQYLTDNMFKLFGIRGTITAVNAQRVPQNYTAFYVECAGEEKNKVIMQLENGEYLVGDTSLDSDGVFKSIENLYDLLKWNDKKFNVEELKKIFEDFLLEIL